VGGLPRIAPVTQIVFFPIRKLLNWEWIQALFGGKTQDKVSISSMTTLHQATHAPRGLVLSLSPRNKEGSLHSLTQAYPHFFFGVD
jgi:hypothetical protein